MVVIWGGALYSVPSNVLFRKGRIQYCIANKVCVFLNNHQRGHKIQKLSISIMHHLLKAPDNIYLNSKEGLKVKITPSVYICISSQRKRQTLLLKDIKPTDTFAVGPNSLF